MSLLFKSQHEVISFWAKLIPGSNSVVVRTTEGSQKASLSAIPVPQKENRLFVHPFTIVGGDNQE